MSQTLTVYKGTYREPEAKRMTFYGGLVRPILVVHHYPGGER